MPKCASTSIEIAINRFCNVHYSGNPKLKHINAEVFTKSILPVHQKLVPSAHIESICLMRDPLSWIESWYRYRSRDALKNPSNPNHKNYTGNISYDEFIMEYISGGKRKSYADLLCQFDFLSIGNNQLGVDNIIPMNRIDLFEDFISDKLGSKFTVPHINSSPKKDLYLDSDLKERLQKYFSKDIILYKFIEDNEKFNKSLHAKNISAALQTKQ